MLNEILAYLPYKSSFRFVDNILSIDENGVTGEYTLKADSFFYQDHFPGNPVTPGVIMTEIMAQVGVVVLGIYLLLNEAKERESCKAGNVFPLLTSTEVAFYKILKPEQRVRVVSKKKYFRFNKLKCSVEMYDELNELVAKGCFAGFIKKVELKEQQNS